VLYGSLNVDVFGDIIAFTRVKKGNPGFLVVANLGNEAIPSVNVSSLPK